MRNSLEIPGTISLSSCSWLRKGCVCMKRGLLSSFQVRGDARIPGSRSVAAVYSFPVAAIANYCTLGGLKQLIDSLTTPVARRPRLVLLD